MKITIEWCANDVLSRDNTLTHEQCMEVLTSCKDNHDADVGINWDVIDYWIEHHKGGN